MGKIYDKAFLCANPSCPRGDFPRYGEHILIPYGQEMYDATGHAICPVCKKRVRKKAFKLSRQQKERRRGEAPSTSFKELKKVLDGDFSILDKMPRRWFVRVKEFHVKNGTMDRIVETLRQHGFVLSKVKTPERYDHLKDYYFEAES